MSSQTNSLHLPVSSLPVQQLKNDNIFTDRAPDHKTGTFVGKQPVDMAPTKLNLFKPESAMITPPQTEIFTVEQVKANCNYSDLDNSPKIHLID